MPYPQDIRGGYWGRILFADVSTGRIEHEEPGEAFYRKYLGGLGLAARMLWERGPAGADPLGPDNLLAITPGLLTDTGSLFTGRFSVAARSPSTGGWGDANAGGFFSPALKRCRIDALFLKGQSPRPVFLYLDEERAEIMDASDLWGLDTVETESRLKERFGKRAQVACIGPAGECLSLMAGVSHDRGRMAARCGLGAVMGAKRIKAVVAAGRSRVPVNDPARMKRLTQAFHHRLRDPRGLRALMTDRFLGFLGWMMRKGPLYTRQPAQLFRVMLRRYGTSALTALSAEAGDSPVMNWKGVGHRDFPLKRSRRIGAEELHRLEVRKYGCFSCPLRCGGIVRFPEKGSGAKESHRPEYETICAFGTLLLNDDLPSILRINDRLNRAGIDTISCGGTVAFAIECFEHGILTARDTGGLVLRWGDGATVERLVEMIIRREGIGELLADGVRVASRHLGEQSEAFAVHCGGLEAPMHDPKFDPGFAMAYQCEPVPSRHTVSSYSLLDLERLDRQFQRAPRPPAFMAPRERVRFENKGEAMALGSSFRMLVDAVGGCVFGTQVGGEIPLLGWIQAATGWDLGEDEALLIGERIEQLRHAFNLREGLHPARDFRLHPRLSGHPPLEAGPAKGVTLDLEAMTQAFFMAMGWDLETAFPSRKRLASLGLEDVAEILYDEKRAF